MGWLTVGILVGTALAKRDDVIDLELSGIDQLMTDTALALMQA